MLSYKRCSYFLLGQRFKSGIRDFPFVLLIIGFDEKFLPSVLDEIKSIAKKQYAKINPLGLTITLRFTRENYKDAEMWNHIVVGKYNQIISDSKYRLDQADSPMNYGEYSKIYERWGKDNTELAKFVSKEPEADLIDSANKGLYFKFYVNDEFAGIICGRKEKIYGHDAVYIFEELLLEKFRGQGLAKTMQRMFHAKFPKIKYIYGHIYEQNRPSLNTAKACNREIIEGEVFFRF